MSHPISSKQTKSSNPSWIELAICVDNETLPIIEEALNQSMALAITYQDNEDEPIFEPNLGETPLWSSTRLTALFKAPLDIDQKISYLQQILAQHSPGRPFPHWQVNRLEDQDWERVWLDNFKPLFFPPNFWVIPSWHTPPDPTATTMLIDPGLAFGTGSHETTALCLSWLASHADLLRRPNLHLIDYGCGSGILAIASIILGASKVTALDIDPQAIMATRQNSSINQINEQQLITQLVPTTPPTSKNLETNRDLATQADVIVANILCEPLIQLSSHFQQLLKRGGQVLFSGILATQIDTLMAIYSEWIVFEPPMLEGEWALLIGTKIEDHPPVN